ncbi:MAG: translation elongation factor Ts, partial [Bifidobacteriaceae bacterium]|nr:translation elongation factor Ts [Bifidobacteriaceae bacterium]
MAKISAALIKELRDATGAGMMDVKKALEEAEGDVARAKELIRAAGVAAAGKREGRKAQEGFVASKVVSENGKQTGYAVELNSETDFVAKTPQFVEFGDEVLSDVIAATASNEKEVLAASSKAGTVEQTIEEAGALFHEHVKLGQFAKISGDRVEIYAHKKS